MAQVIAASGSGNGDAAAAEKAVSFAAFKTQLVVPGQKADAAVQFYKEAFGAEELKRMTHPKRKADQEIPLILYAELKIGSSSLLVCDQTDVSAVAVKDGAGGGIGSGIFFRLETDNMDDAVLKAMNAGATLEGEIVEDEVACGGDQVRKVKDPFGVVWMIVSAAKKPAEAEI